ncbi:MAG: carboxymuconolactone decarboxylase family protein [Clostridia bacterium]|nr:carboxymuconolactone decarboxylase family protein [Clostridia bacterium]
MHKEIPAHYQRIAEAYPEFLKAVENLGAATKGAGTLSDKKANLVQLAAAVAIRSEGAVHSHTRQLLQAGTDASEIRHAIILLTSTIGFPTVMAGLSWANDVIDAFE